MVFHEGLRMVARNIAFAKSDVVTFSAAYFLKILMVVRYL